MAKRIAIAVDSLGTVTAIAYPAAKPRRASVTFILAHGAGGNQESPFMVEFAQALAARGFGMLTFNFLYSEKGAGAPGRDDLAGLVFLGYPLHPPGQPEKLRSKHLPDIKTPMLFIQGSRDAFGTPEELRPILRGSRAPVELCVVEGGDHSFKAPKSAGRTPTQIRDFMLDAIERWVVGLK